MRGVTTTNLHRHVHLRRFVQNALHSPVISPTELFLKLQLAHVDRKGGSVRKIDSFGVQDGLAIEVQCTRRIANHQSTILTTSRRNQTHTIFPKLAKGVPHVCPAGERRGMSSMTGRPPPRPALLGPPPDGRPMSPTARSLTLSFGPALRAARPPRGPGGRPGADGAD